MKLLANRYELDSIAGKGGTSVVYKAYDLQAERAVRAIKEISKSNPDVYEMAKRESQLIKELYERDTSYGFLPNIIHRFELGDKFYIVQDFLDGDTMDKLLEAEPMPPDMFIECAGQICQFMTFFHSTGRIHSDMKPDNIMVIRPEMLWDNSREHTVKLKFIDFGTAVKNEDGEIRGYTPEYAAPEQARESRVDERTDIFNIGATFFHMITGRRPQRVLSDTRVLTAAERFRFDKNTNAAIKKIILKCVQDDPEMRYKSCDAVYRDLMRIEKHFHLRLISALYTLSLICFLGAGLSAILAGVQTARNANNRYTECVNSGQYAEALKIDHTNRDGIYTNLISSFTEDEKLDTEEHNFIINEIKSRNDLTPEDESYGRIMYEIGNAYWLYYDPHTEGKALQENELEKDRIMVSYEWLEKAVSDPHFAEADPETFNRASIFCSIGRFYVEIDRKEREGTDNRQFYQNMWESITQMSAFIDDFNEVISARVCQTLCSLISRYSPKFRQVGITEDQQAVILDRIEGKIRKDGAITYRNKYSVGIAEQIDVDAVRLKLSMAYAE